MNIGIIGVGRLGLAYGLVLEQKGFTVIASSYKKEYVDELKLKQTSSTEPGINQALSESKNIVFTTDNHEVINSCDIIYVMVATPSTGQGDYDVSAVHSVADDFINHPSDVTDKILIIGSTVNPDTCNPLQDRLHSRGVHIVYCPTFAAQGSVLNDIQNPHSLLLGTENKLVAKKCQETFLPVCGIDTPVFRVHPTTAEILKLGGNCRATMEISYFNMMSQILIQSGMNQDLNDASKYLNFVKKEANWRHGFGYGGPCYPRDNKALVHYANNIGIDFPLGKVIDNFNNSHIEFLTNYFLQDNKKQLPFYFDYVSYKRGVNMFEESHQLKVCKNLLRTGVTVYIEPSIYLLPVIIQELQQEFPTVEFVSLENLTTQNITVYNVTTY